ncbi:DUF1365 domain-containing protein [Gilvimarinus sp. DA14]|uniref:DUF1365 domain-containing protein n=1 Tax=Gilvimarinus sp. DA14 TaxID=2956798 RepID=UPI0020B6C926|nr:DUF1365 domain-containing protein [Gilvimarinus sp. DA14]UTF60704.1 DUF1365 domain-containing protein [Gilvimarinus sp. DA14]
MSTPNPESAIYSGWVRHRRFTPKKHEFSYRQHLFFMDLDALPELFSQSRLWSFNKSNLGCFRREDYMAPVSQNLKDVVLQKAQAVIDTDAPCKVFLLANLRLWGFCFNPVSLYYVYQNSRLMAIVAEVNNTPWNERHCYLVPMDEKQRANDVRFSKKFHVSPFNPLAMDYHWFSSRPGEKLSVHMENHKQGVKHMDATLTLSKESWSAAHLNRILWRTPYNSIKVPIAIYWQALKLWLKRVPVYNHPGSDLAEEKHCD